MTGAITGTDVGETRAWFEKQLRQHQQQLRALPDTCHPVGRARVELNIAKTLVGLNRLNEAWELARSAFDVFAAHELWQDAVEVCDILYLADQEDSIVALGNRIWIAVTYPVIPEFSVRPLHRIVDEIPEESDDAAVAAMAAHYFADLRAKG